MARNSIIARANSTDKVKLLQAGNIWLGCQLFTSAVDFGLRPVHGTKAAREFAKEKKIRLKLVPSNRKGSRSSTLGSHWISRAGVFTELIGFCRRGISRKDWFSSFY
jgi:hypothetical protein